MAIFYSPSTKGFYEDILPVPIPKDAVPVTAEQREEMLACLNSGGSVDISKGKPALHPYEPPAATQDDLIAYAANKRWQVETGGMKIGGVEVATDDRSKIMIMGARMMAEANPDYTEDWKVGDGEHVTLSAQQLIAFSDAVLKHVSDCFTAEAEVVAAIKSGKIASTAQIDAYPWPGGTS